MGVFSNYCGLGGSGIPQHLIDSICEQHDRDYQQIIDKHGYAAAYLKFNWADKKFLDKVRAATPQDQRQRVLQYVSERYFSAKEALAAKHGVEQTPEKKRLRGKEKTITPQRKMPRRGEKHEPYAKDDDMDTEHPTAPTGGDHPSCPAGNIFSASAAVGTRGGLHEETALSSIPINKSTRNPFAPTAQAWLRYHKYTTGVSIATGTESSACATYTWRLNSIIDCTRNYSFVDLIPDKTDPTKYTEVAGDSPDSKPMWRDYWLNLYYYWTVRKSNYSVRIIPSTQKASGQVNCYLYFHGQQFPPKLYGSTIVPHEYRTQHPGVMWKRLDMLPEPVGTGYMVENERHTGIEFSGEWEPGKIQHEVIEDEQMQTWHVYDQVPPTCEYMTLMIQRSEISSDAALTFEIIVDIDYCTQFKDLKTTYQYVVPTTSLPALTNFIQGAN
jgi:hypothetical protein